MVMRFRVKCQSLGFEMIIARVLCKSHWFKDILEAINLDLKNNR